jgi:hypothetical protein
MAARVASAKNVPELTVVAHFRFIGNSRRWLEIADLADLV